MSPDLRIAAAAETLAAQGDSRPVPARDPVNQAMVNNWVEAIGDTNRCYTDAGFAASSVHGGLVAPPAMAQVWTMRGLHGDRAADDPLGVMVSTLDAEGYTSVVATNTEQTYHRYLRPGEHVSVSSRLDDVVGPKQTALGEGYFVTTRTSWTVDGELVAEMLFRVLKFRPPGDVAPASTTNQPLGSTCSQPKPPETVIRPVISKDTEFFWAGLQAGELRIQRWGSTLRHPPGPVDPSGDLSTTPDYVVASGRGTVYSFVVHHHPQVPGKTVPFVVALVELDEGVRVLGELVDADPATVHIGLPVRVVFQRVDDELTLPAWKADA